MMVEAECMRKPCNTFTQNESDREYGMVACCEVMEEWRSHYADVAAVWASYERRNGDPGKGSAAGG
jgi:hypothetical protein